ncbi:MAG: NAD(P)/FAD-dependent oxidoreductase [Balneolales bacterium]
MINDSLNTRGSSCKSDSPEYCDVLIAGAGPVGLLLGHRLNQLGINFIVLEKRNDPYNHSRSIGIHPPSLELFDQIDISKLLLNKGICIKKGRAYYDANELLGTLNFTLCPGPHQYVLTLPQYQTEQILRDSLLEKAPGCIKSGVEVLGLRQYDHYVETEAYKGRKKISYRTSYLIGCDGKASIVREKSGISFTGGKYPYRYAMGDFDDNTGYVNQAAIYIGDEGLVETFPLSDGVRRWVAELPGITDECTISQFCGIISRRTGFIISQSSNSMFSNFEAEHYMAGRFHQNRVLLTGDSAHILSPIGGQGMNLGWLDAWHLGKALQETLNQKSPSMQPLVRWEKRRMQSARKAITRAEINMALGQKSQWPKLRKMAIERLINFPFNRLMSRMFTMRGLS